VNNAITKQEQVTNMKLLSSENDMRIVLSDLWWILVITGDFMLAVRIGDYWKFYVSSSNW
jgi:hypothetical protein